MGDASTKEKKLVSYWNKSTEVNHSKYAWFLKDVEDESLQLYLYSSKNFDAESNELVGKLLDLYILPNTKSVYILSKLPKSHDKHRYHFTLSMDNTGDYSLKICKQIIQNIAQKIVSIFIYTYLFCVIQTVSLYF